MIDRFVDPYTGTVLLKDLDGNLWCSNGDRKVLYKSYEGCYDFVVADPEMQKERDHYDKEYLQKRIEKLTPSGVRSEWFDEMTPWRRRLLESLGDLSGKQILLLGNGDSSKEIYFLLLDANVVFTDLSIEAVVRKKQEFELAEFHWTGAGNIEFHAMNAYHLPFPDSTFDIIYGAAFVHHLDDLDQYFKEVHRVLKPGGICRFIDQAHSPLWRLMTQSVLYPLKRWSYWKNPRSPADLRSDARGGYTREDIRFYMKKYGFRDMLFKREWFFFRIVTRHYGKMFNYSSSAMRRARPLFRVMKWIDTLLARTSFMTCNGLMLVWGFKK